MGICTRVPPGHDVDSSFKFDKDDPLGALIPLMTTDLSAPFSRKIYCADSSADRGAVLESEIGEEMADLAFTFEFILRSLKELPKLQLVFPSGG